MLQCLVAQPGQLISHEELLARVWGEVHLSEGVLKTQIRELRQALADRARAPRFIETVHSRGYRFIGCLDSDSPRAQRARAPAFTPAVVDAPDPGTEHVVGRNAELSALQTRWAKARTGNRQVVFALGEAGIGKTVLVKSFLQRLGREEDLLLLWGQCIDQYGAGEPYLPILEALRRACSRANNEPLREGVREHAPLWRALTMPAQETAPATVELAPTLPGRMLREVADVLEAVSRQMPVILLVEDLHWADFSTLDALAYLAQRTDPARLFVLATSRPQALSPPRLGDVIDRLKVQNRCFELTVPPLSQRAVVDYLTLRFPEHRLPPDLPELIHQRTEGNALFMVSVVDDWLGRGLLQATRGTWELAAPLNELTRSAPDSFVRMVERELERLSPLERAILEAASVAGYEFSTAVVAAALAKELVEVEEVCLRWARRGQFLSAIGKAEWQDGTLVERCRFLHVLYQEVTYARLGAARRALLHQRVGERLEAGYIADPETIAVELALHFQESKDYPRAVRYLRYAGERALSRSAFREAMAHLTRALDLVAKLPAAPEYADIELHLRILMFLPLRAVKGHGASELENAYTEALQLCEKRGSTAQQLLVMAGLGSLHVLRGTHGAALEVGQRLLALAEQVGDESSTEDAHLVVGAAYHFLGQHHVARRHLARVIAGLERRREANAGDARDRLANLIAFDRGFARTVFALSSYMLGHRHEAKKALAESIALAGSLDNPFAVAQAVDVSAFVCMLSGDAAGAREHVQSLGALSVEHGFALYASATLLHTADLRIESGDWDAGIELMNRALASFAATGSRVHLTFRMGLLAKAHAGAGRVRMALEIIDKTLQTEAGGEHLWDPELLRIKAELLLLEGRAEDAEGHLLRALELARAQSSKFLELRIAMSLARYWRSSGDAERGRELLSDVYDWFGGELATADLERARALLEELRCGPTA